MPKVDSSRNYYADLQAAPSDSVDEIKKKYKKLALKWHPDRNPGKEEEVNAKFQSIQSAYEILVDPSLRKQYDDARNKSSSRYPGASGVRGNPWANAGSNFPPPPRRGAAAGTTSSNQPRPSSGASRYSNFTKNAPQADKPSQTGDTEAHYRAWQGMRNGNRRPTNPPPPPPRRAPTAAREPKTSDSENIPKTAFQKQKAQASFGNSSRRPGFTPRSPELGDEPPVTNKNYYTDRTHTNIFNETTSNNARQNRQTFATADPLAQFRGASTDDRQSTPYATPGGEKTSLFDEEPGISRAKSHREPSRSTEKGGTDTFPFPQQRPRSSSTPRSSSNDGGSEDSTKVNTGQRRPSNNNRTYSRASDRYKPKSDPTAPAPSDSAGANTNPFAANNTTPTTAGPTSNPSKTCYTFLKSQRPDPNQWDAGLGVACEDGSPSGVTVYDCLSSPHVEDILKKTLNTLIDKKHRLPINDRSHDLYPKHIHGTPHGACDEVGKRTDDFELNSFNFTAGPETPGKTAGQKRFASTSAENINTKFVDDENVEGWEFKAGGDPSSESYTPSSKLRSQSSSRLGRRSPTKMARQTRTAQKSAEDEPSTQRDSDDASRPGFSAGEWSEKIASHHFFHQPSNASASPTRRTPSRRNTRPVKRTMGGSAGLVDDDENSSAEGWQDIPTHNSSGNASPMAMDIDTPPVERNSDIPKMSQENGARKIHVEPTRPEWRPGNITESAPVPPPRPAVNPDAAALPYTGKPGIQSTPAPSNPQPFANVNGGSEDSEEFRASFSDFKKVEPIADPIPTGLQSFADMKTTLPFESRPSEHMPHDIGQPAAAPLEFPTAPVAPRLPPTMAVSGIRPSHGQWRKYFQEFCIYEEKWETFNQKVLTHFSARQAEYSKRCQKHGRTWLDGVPGVDSASIYLTELEQDQEVRRQWIKACEDHQTRIREFLKFRDRAK
ncbi:hypothetical protein BX600DRAFT_504636 [Xylariales sp. PMI_506]|nr:hypothetical protein BX600DRAFT_504636 [Xylariales sp. PMI_506]